MGLNFIQTNLMMEYMGDPPHRKRNCSADQSNKASIGGKIPKVHRRGRVRKMKWRAKSTPERDGRYLNGIKNEKYILSEHENFKPQVEKVDLPGNDVEYQEDSYVERSRQMSEFINIWCSVNEGLRCWGSSQRELSQGQSDPGEDEDEHLGHQFSREVDVIGGWEGINKPQRGKSTW